MTTIRIPAGIIKTGVLIAQKFAGKGVWFPELHNAFFADVDGQHVLLATDINAFCTYTLPFPHIGNFAVNVHKLASWLRKLRKTEMLEMTLVNKTLLLSTSRYRLAFETDPTADMPLVKVSKPACHFSLKRPAALITASSHDQSKPALCGATVTPIAIVAADEFRLHTQTIKVEWAKGADRFEHVRIPYAAFRHAKNPVTIAINRDHKYVTVQQGPLSVITSTDWKAYDVVRATEVFPDDLDVYSPVPPQAYHAFEFFRSEVAVHIMPEGVYLDETPTRVLADCPFPYPGNAVAPSLMADALAFLGHPAKVYQKLVKHPFVFVANEHRALVMPIAAHHPIVLPEYLHP
jgi:hypothetical protein